MPPADAHGDHPSAGGPRLTRRRFLAGSGILAGTGFFGFRFLHRHTNRLRPRLDRHAPTGRLGEAELATVLALLDVIVAEPMHETREAMAVLVNRATERVPGVLKEYRQGAELLEATAHQAGTGSFATATRPDRAAILDAIVWQYPALTGSTFADLAGRSLVRLDRLVLGEPARRFRELVVRDLLTRYYHRYAWHLLPYDNVPGRPGHPRGYTEPPSGDGAVEGLG
jgi:hypothetical protein